MKLWSYKFLPLSMLMLGLVSCAGPIAAQAEDPIKLWPSGNPKGWTAEQAEKSEIGKDQVLRISHVESPTLTYFPPTNGAVHSSTAVVICPGGGYRILAMNKEGTDIARFLVEHGFHAFVLKYRLPNKGDVRHQAALEDAQRAIEVVRERSAELGIDAVGIMGFSAGGHLAATVAATGTPDFVALVYPAYFFGKDGAPNLSAEIKPHADSPPAFLVHALNDRIPARNSIVYAEALAELKIAAECHLYARGGHGYGMTLTDKLPVGDWRQYFLRWLSRQSH